MAKPAAKRATFEEYSRAKARPVVDGELLDVEDGSSTQANTPNLLDELMPQAAMGDSVGALVN